MKNHLLYLLFPLALLSSCNTSKEIIYFQDVEVNIPKAIAPPQDITVQPKDQISIMVSSKDPELAALFNLTRVQYKVGSPEQNSGSYQHGRRPDHLRQAGCHLRNPRGKRRTGDALGGSPFLRSIQISRLLPEAERRGVCATQQGACRTIHPE